MKVHIDFTLEVPPGSLAALRAMAEADTTADAAWFVRAEAEEQIRSYLDNHQVRARTVRRDGAQVKEEFAW